MLCIPQDRRLHLSCILLLLDIQSQKNRVNHDYILGIILVVYVFILNYYFIMFKIHASSNSIGMCYILQRVHL
jgi:hypothetical protein